MGASMSSFATMFHYHRLASSPKSKKPTKIDTSDLQGWHPLHVAAYNGDVKKVRQLLSKGAYINAIDAKGRTPLHFARACKHGELNDMISDILISAGASDNFPLDSFGRAPRDVQDLYIHIQT